MFNSPTQKKQISTINIKYLASSILCRSFRVRWSRSSTTPSGISFFTFRAGKPNWRDALLSSSTELKRTPEPSTFTVAGTSRSVRHWVEMILFTLLSFTPLAPFWMAEHVTCCKLGHNHAWVCFQLQPMQTTAPYWELPLYKTLERHHSITFSSKNNNSD